jgi:FlaA1/EpsC-like NDP-sugar epimerase
MWRYVGVKDLQRIVLAVALAAALVGACVFMFQLGDVPRSVLILQPLLLIMAMGGTRFAYRAWREHQLYGGVHLEGEPVLILGAGDAAMMLLRELKRSRGMARGGPARRRGGQARTRIDGVPVLGSLDSVAGHAEPAAGERNAIIAMPSAAPQRRRAAEAATAAGTRRADGAGDRRPPFRPCFHLASAQGRTGGPARPRVVTLDERRPAPAARRQTGAGHRRGRVDRIGAVRARSRASSRARLVLFELSEFALYRIEQEFAGGLTDTPIACVWWAT